MTWLVFVYPETVEPKFSPLSVVHNPSEVFSSNLDMTNVLENIPIIQNETFILFYSKTRIPGRYAPLILAPAEGG